MNKLIFLTSLLTAFLFIGTAHGGPYNRKASELAEQQILQAMMQDSTGVMETFDEEGNEMADEQISASDIFKALGCAGAKYICSKQALMMDDRAKTQQWFVGAGSIIVEAFQAILSSPAIKKGFCSTADRIC